MDFDLERDDILRNVMPGLIFAIVLISYGIFWPVGLDFLKINANDLSALLLVVAAYPLGFLIHVIYRTVLHTGALFYDNGTCSEQLHMERYEESFVPLVLKDRLLAQLNISKDESYLVTKTISQFLSMSLNGEGQKEFKHRMDFLLSFMHGIGASRLSIILGIGFVVIKKFHDSCSLDIDLFVSPKLAWTIVWLVIFGILSIGREKTIESQQLSMRVYLGSRAFRDYVTAYLYNS